jgi:hypothetical protein
MQSTGAAATAPFSMLRTLCRSVLAPGGFMMEAVMAIPDYARKNFNTLLRAAEAGHLALMECTDAATGEPRYVLTAVGWQDGEYVMTPFGHIADANPYELYVPPESGSAPTRGPET